MLPFSEYRKTVPKYKAGYPVVPQTFGEHVKKARMDQGLLQTDLAELLGVSEDTLRFWEDGTTALPTAKHFPSLIAFIGYYPLTHETDTIAGKLRQLRYCHGYNYEQCGVAFGVNASTIRTWELGTSVPKSGMAELIHIRHAQLLESIKNKTINNDETEQTGG